MHSTRRTKVSRCVTARKELLVDDELIGVVVMFADAWKISEKYGEDRKREVAAKLKAYIVAHRNDDAKHAATLAQALCACRIFLRERVAIEPLMNVEFLEVLLALCTTADPEHLAAEVPANALKSTINVLYNNQPMLHAFNQMQGPHALLEVVKQSRPLTVHWLTIRAIHMLVSASDSFCQQYFQLGVLDALVTVRACDCLARESR